MFHLKVHILWVSGFMGLSWVVHFQSLIAHQAHHNEQQWYLLNGRMWYMKMFGVIILSHWEAKFSLGWYCFIWLFCWYYAARNCRQIQPLTYIGQPPRLITTWEKNHDLPCIWNKNMNQYFYFSFLIMVYPLVCHLRVGCRNSSYAPNHLVLVGSLF